MYKNNANQITVFITEITKYGDLYCIAGYDVNTMYRVRPKSVERFDGFWNKDELDSWKIAIGNALTFIPDTNRNAIPTNTPHDFENSYVKKFISYTPNLTFNINDIPNISTIQNILPCLKQTSNKSLYIHDRNSHLVSTCSYFENPYEPIDTSLERKLYYPKIPSLVYVSVDKFTIQESYVYVDQLPGLGDVRFRNKSINSESISEGEHQMPVVLCLGLAQPWDKHDYRCYLQCNNILAL